MAKKKKTRRDPSLPTFKPGRPIDMAAGVLGVMVEAKRPKPADDEPPAPAPLKFEQRALDQSLIRPTDLDIISKAAAAKIVTSDLMAMPHMAEAEAVIRAEVERVMRKYGLVR